MPSEYGQFCPVAEAMELLDERWTLLVVREMLSGSRHFNDLRRGVPRMSPTLLSRRLQQLAMQSRLKIPLLFGYDVIHGHRTIFPISLGEAA